MRMVPAILLCMALIATTASGSASAQGAPPGGDLIFGYLDPQTNTFTPRRVAQPLASAAARITRGGKITIETNFKIRSPIPQSATIEGGALISVVSGRYSGNVRGDAQVTRNGGTGKASITFKYLFAAASASAPMTVTVFLGANTPTGEFTRIVQTIPLPADGADTLLKVDASL